MFFSIWGSSSLHLRKWFRMRKEYSCPRPLKSDQCYWNTLQCYGKCPQAIINVLVSTPILLARTLIPKPEEK